MKRSYEPLDFPVYEDLPMEISIRKAAKIVKAVECSKGGFLPKNAECNAYTMCEIVNKVQMRKVYFKVFHDCIMGEINEVALYCFWIIKFSPFYLQGHQTIELNVKIAMYFLTTALRFHAAKKGAVFSVSEKVVQELYYSLKNRDLSKEAIMILANSLAV